MGVILRKREGIEMSAVTAASVEEADAAAAEWVEIIEPR